MAGGVETSVVVGDGGYSVWSGRQPIPAGWRREGFHGSRAECLAYVGTVWSGAAVAPDAGETGDGVPVGDDETHLRSAAAGHRLDLLLAASAREHADAVALTIDDTDTTYDELFGRARLLAGRLVAQGAREGCFVAVAVDRSTTAVIGLLAVVLCGAAYIPMDTQAPRLRLREIAEQASIRLLTGAIPDGLAADLGLAYVPVPEREPAAPSPGPVVYRHPGDAAYAIFTSGSTGRPKGVVVSHQAIVNSTTARFGVFPRESMSYLMLAPLTFDAALAGLYFTLAAGGRLLVPTTEEVHDPGLVADLVGRHAATHLDGVPSQYAAILEYHAASLESLKCVIVAGEALAQGLVQRHAAALPGVSLFNEYGPTESTVWSTWHLADAADDGPYAPIGRPVDGVEVDVLDDALEPVAPGETGQLAISGRQLARGYLGQPSLTADRFVPHPRRRGQRLYLTGDRGRVDARGRLVYCGRLDSMVKVRGFRVEVGEVEVWLRAEPDVVDAVVVPQRFSGTTRLVAVTVPSASSHPSALPPLRSRLGRRLPDFMVPSVWHELDRMPLTPHGKVDRAAVAALVGVVLD